MNPRGSIGQAVAVVRLSPEKGHSGALVGRHMGTPCLLMWTLSSTSPALVELAGDRSSSGPAPGMGTGSWRSFPGQGAKQPRKRF